MNDKVAQNNDDYDDEDEDDKEHEPDQADEDSAEEAFQTLKKRVEGQDGKIRQSSNLMEWTSSGHETEKPMHLKSAIENPIEEHLKIGNFANGSDQIARQSMPVHPTSLTDPMNLLNDDYKDAYEVSAKDLRQHDQPTMKLLNNSSEQTNRFLNL